MLRKVSVLLAVLVTVGVTGAHAQFQVTPLVGYQFGGNFKSGSTFSAVVPDTLSALGLSGGFQWGLLVGYGFGEVFQLELQYDRQNSQLEIDEAVSHQRSSLVRHSSPKESSIFRPGILRSWYWPC